jgi:hypothetical protein
MGLIQSVAPEQAEGDMKEAFDFFQQALGTIPAPMAMYSVSPDLFGKQLQSMNYFMKHPTLGFALLSSIRYVVSKAKNYHYCTGFNKAFLEKQGLTEAQILALDKDPQSAPLDDKDRAMLAFVAKAVESPDSVTQDDMDQLHALEWTDRDILDAMAHAASIISASVLMKTFKLDITC